MSWRWPRGHARQLAVWNHRPAQRAALGAARLLPLGPRDHGHRALLCPCGLCDAEGRLGFVRSGATISSRIDVSPCYPCVCERGEGESPHVSGAVSRIVTGCVRPSVAAFPGVSGQQIGPCGPMSGPRWPGLALSFIKRPPRSKAVRIAALNGFQGLRPLAHRGAKPTQAKERTEARCGRATHCLSLSLVSLLVSFPIYSRLCDEVVVEPGRDALASD